MKERTLSLECVVCQSGKKFAALCIDLNIASEGRTFEEAKANLLEAVVGYLEYAASSGRLGELVPRRAPQWLVNEYLKPKDKSRRCSFALPEFIRDFGNQAAAASLISV